MKRIGLISDTHGAISKRTLNFLENVDEGLACRGHRDSRIG